MLRVKFCIFVTIHPQSTEATHLTGWPLRWLSRCPLLGISFWQSYEGWMPFLWIFLQHNHQGVNYSRGRKPCVTFTGPLPGLRAPLPFSWFQTYLNSKEKNRSKFSHHYSNYSLKSMSYNVLMSQQCPRCMPVGANTLWSIIGHTQSTARSTKPLY